MARRTARPRQRASAAVPASAAAPAGCPCGLPEPYEACCGRYHAGGEADTVAAPTAEALMRSRYSAFVRGDTGYLLRTWHPRTRPERLELDPGMRWTGLEILGTADGTAFHPTGTVEFRASYRGGALHERSRFERVAGAWVYVDGEFPE
ncbi:YchJ family protein [Streptomyces sp. NPDC060000]|uniref:YchJ family protein n=1 Tax=Streptomyces sp. NPDC060000 TaxID=3347031 RepID=UPI0036758C87